MRRRSGTDEAMLPAPAPQARAREESARLVGPVHAPAAVSAMGRLAGNRAVSRLLAGAEPVVQRKLGFEFQSVRNTFVPGGDIPAVAEKERVYEGSEGLFRVEGDNATATQADLEFVTRATDDIPEALAAVHGASLVARDLGEHGDRVARAGAGPYAGRWLRDARLRVPDPQFTATPQATIGVPLDKIATLLGHAMDVPVAKNESFMTGEIRKIRAEEGDRVRHRTAAWSGQQQLSGAVSGLLSMVAYYLEAGSRGPEKVAKPTETSVLLDGQWWDLGTTDGPKASFGLMARTSFRAAFLSLSEPDQATFRALMTPAAAATAVGIEPVLGSRLTMSSRFPVSPYLADPDVVGQDADLRDMFQIRKAQGHAGQVVHVVTAGPTVQQWLASICGDVPGYGRAGRDLMSPPIGWGKRDPALEQKDPFPGEKEIRDRRLYGMGAYPMDTRAGADEGAEKLFIVEIRALSDSLQHVDLPANPPAGRWVQTAGAVLSHHFAGLLTAESAALWDTIRTAGAAEGVGALRLAMPALVAYLSGQKATVTS